MVAFVGINQLSMQVILIKTVANLGEAGSIKNVKPGFARNYLIPNGLAEIATPASVSKAEAQKIRQSREHSASEEELKLTLSKIEGSVLEMSAPSNEEGKLYGSITGQQVLEQLSKKFKLIIPKHTVIEPNSIKQVGQIPARLVVSKHQPASFIIDVRSVI